MMTTQYKCVPGWVAQQLVQLVTTYNMPMQRCIISNIKFSFLAIGDNGLVLTVPLVDLAWC
jgi:hypothetical protein